MRRLVVAGLALALVAGACGSATSSKATKSEPKVATARLVSAAADAAAAAKTAKISGSMDIAVAGQNLTAPISGVIDFENQAAELEVDLSGIGGGVMSGAMEIRMVDGVMYMNMGAMLGARASSLLGGKDWIAVDTKAMGAQSSGTQNPADMLQSLRGAGDVEYVGHGRIDGVEVDHYRAEIDLQKAIAKLPEKYRAQSEQGMKLLGNGFPVDVWIDGDGLPRRFALDLDLGGKGSVKEQVDYTDYGAPVTVVAPPADQVQSMDDFTRASGGASANAL